ncbi:hypothetical protein O9K51_02194 [Purpureocillium lavendulum]|uniref:Uncharacterized protein n=1 Tax=Purpureocillium lavendulum TaxID=1247861 RepID=A0AB34FYD6_9HYPO|nr:hypothetical protein O9K51_02194 [Purpureocillium lavendulum]
MAFVSCPPDGPLLKLPGHQDLVLPPMQGIERYAFLPQSASVHLVQAVLRGIEAAEQPRSTHAAPMSPDTSCLCFNRTGAAAVWAAPAPSTVVETRDDPSVEPAGPAPRVSAGQIVATDG